MAATTAAFATPRPRSGPVARGHVDELSRWLLLAMALDLLVTRVVVRLAIFVPKGEPWTTVSAVLGRVGGLTDALVPIVGLLLLGALLLRAGRIGGSGEQLVVAALTTVAAGGLALVAFPPTPVVATLMSLLVAGTAIGAGIRLARDSSTPAIARIGLVSLAGASIGYDSITDFDANGLTTQFLDLVRLCERSRGFGDFWAHMLVAEGALDIAIEPVVSHWDMAAVQVIVEEAGGRFTSLRGEPRADGGSGLSTNGLLHDEVLRYMR